MSGERTTVDAVTTLGSGVDGAVRRIETAYDSQGNAYKVTSYDAASGGNVVNEILREFSGVGRLRKEYPEHGGAVKTSTSPKVRYAYSEMASGANHSRLTTITHPWFAPSTRISPWGNCHPSSKYYLTSLTAGQ